MNDLKRLISAIILLFIIISTLIVSIAHPIFQSNTPKAQQGVLDLSKWDFKENGQVQLDGQWELYDNLQLSPDDFTHANQNSYKPTAYAVSGSIFEADGERLKLSGIKTYRLMVNTDDKPQSLAIKVSTLGKGNKKLYINGELIVVNLEDTHIMGRILPSYAPHEVFFKHEGKQIEIILQMNDSKPIYPLPFLITLGNQHDIFSKTTITSAIELSGAALCLVMTIYFLCVYYAIPQNKSTLYLGIQYFSLCIMFLCAGEILIATIVPNFPIQLYSKLVTICSVALPMAIIAYFNGRTITKKTTKMILIIFFVMGSITLCLPYEIYRLGIISIHLIEYIIFKYILWKLIVQFRQAQPNSQDRRVNLIHLLCLLALTISLINNTLYMISWTPSKAIGSIAIVVYLILSQTTLAFHFIRNYNKMLEMDKIKDEYIINTSYELKAPLVGVKSMANSLKAAIQNRNYTYETLNHVSMISQTSNKLLTIVDTTLDVILLRNNQLKLVSSVIDIKICVELAVEEVAPLFDHKQINIIIDIPYHLLVRGDELRMRQVLTHLLQNSLRSMAQGSIFIRAIRHKNNVHMTVEDTGEGIAKEQWEHIFNPYVTLNSKGLGLGLYISRQLIQLMGGEIKVEWSEPGKGSRLGFYFPLDSTLLSSHDTVTSHRVVQDKAIVIANTAEDEKSKGLILIVDDEPHNVQTVVNILKQVGYTLLTAYSGEEALRMTEQYNIDLVILDVMLPGQSGIAICGAIRERYTIIELPVLMSTVGYVERDMERAISVGANDFITKPFDEKEVTQRVSGLISLKKAMEETVNNELAFLQAQIQPHFIYNALSTIISFCYTDNEKAAELLTSFSHYLRFTFDIDPHMTHIPLRRELEMINIYMEIEQARFGNKFRLNYDIDEQLLEQHIPPLCIQPLVENAIKHGLYTKEEGGIVAISAKRADKSLIITVEDNGVGMTEQELFKLNQLENNTGSVGFANIHRRIRRLKQSQLNIISTIDVGTKVVLTLQLSNISPKEKELETNHLR